MSILFDTNLLTRSMQPGSLHFAAASAATRKLIDRGERVCVVPQVLYEFWAVCTRPAGENGLGISTPEAWAAQGQVLSVFALLPDQPAVLAEWQRLVLRHDVKGKNAHDARLVAAMSVHGVRRIVTFNGAHFARYPGIEVLDPMSFAQPGV